MYQTALKEQTNTLSKRKEEAGSVWNNVKQTKVTWCEMERPEEKQQVCQHFLFLFKQISKIKNERRRSKTATLCNPVKF